MVKGNKQMNEKREEYIFAGGMQKKLHLEIIRILALFCIVFDHTGPRGSSLYTFTDGRLTWLVSLTGAVVCKVGVPLFFMISGALLLRKEESWKKVYTGRLPRILTVLLLFTLLRYLYEGLVSGRLVFSAVGFAKVLWTGELFLPYWFLYTYCGLLLLLPFLRRMVRNLTDEEERLMAVLLAVTLSGLPLLQAFGLPMIGVPVLVTESLGCFLMGYLLEEGSFLEKKIGQQSLLLALAGAAVVLLNGVLTVQVYAGTSVPSLGMIVPAAAVFLWIGKLVRLCPHSRLDSVIGSLGGCVFGVYLVEDYLRNGLAFIWEALAPRISALPACGIWLAAVMVIGFLLVLCLKKIPLLGKLL